MVAVQRVATTVIAVVGPEAGACAAALGAAANVRAVVPDAEGAPLDRAVSAWREAQRAHIPWLVHDADPLAGVADAWSATFDQQAGRGALEVEVAAAVARWRARSVELPDYYLVLDPESWPATRRHFHLGFLHRAAPHRVVPTTPAAAATAIAHLHAGRWWPDLDRLLADVDQVVPDRVGTEPSLPTAPQLAH